MTDQKVATWEEVEDWYAGELTEKYGYWGEWVAALIALAEAERDRADFCEKQFAKLSKRERRLSERYDDLDTENTELRELLGKAEPWLRDADDSLRLEEAEAPGEAYRAALRNAIGTDLANKCLDAIRPSGDKESDPEQGGKIPDQEE